ncbi:MAG: hypothetical protein ABL999_12055 [Pyrinomonadaceae bacterium]
MKKQLSDEQLDQMMRRLMSDAMVDDDELDNIAESPSIWWGIQRNISQNASPWPPSTKWWRVFFIGVPAAAALVLLIVFALSSRPVNVGPEQVGSVDSPQATVSNETKLDIEGSNRGEVFREKQADFTLVSTRPSSNPPIRRSHSAKSERRSSARTVELPAIVKELKEPIKTDFIALTYADNPESGQIVRVKVPSSMMVTLGLVASVEKPASLVDAEVLVGDDGLTHSIRFIRKAL